MKKNKNRENLVSKTADLLSKINYLSPKKSLASDKEENQINPYCLFREISRREIYLVFARIVYRVLL